MATRRKKAAKEPGPPEVVGYDPEDLTTVNDELDEQDELLKGAQQHWKDQCKIIKARAKKDLNIPIPELNASRAAAKLSEKQKKIFDSVPPARTEIFLDMLKARLGDFADTELGAATISDAEKSIDTRRAAMEKNEQKDGERVLDRAH